MIYVDGYSLLYDKGRNKITIGLPQTVFTPADTISPVVNRRVDVEDEELAVVLITAKALFEKKEGENA